MFENNRVTKLLKTKYPIIQGGMAWVADADLAAAVSNAGGLGIIAAASMPANLLEEQVIKIRTLTDKPFGMNIMLMSPTADDAMEIAAKVLPLLLSPYSTDMPPITIRPSISSSGGLNSLGSSSAKEMVRL